MLPILLERVLFSVEGQACSRGRESKKGERAHCADPTGSDLGVAAF